MKAKKPLKTLLITLAVLAGVAAVGFGAYYFLGNRSAEPVNVYSFQYLGMTEYWGDSQESYGPVTTDRVQTVFLSGTQKVTGILVKQGDTVKKGDVLMTFDTTLTDIALERERLAVEKVKLQLSQAQDRLREINAMKPMVIPSTTPQPTTPVNKGTALSGSYQISTDKAYDGSSESKALILWIGDSVQLSDEILEKVRSTAESYQESNAPAPTVPPTEPSSETTQTTSTEDTTTTSTEGTSSETSDPTGESSSETSEPTTEPSSSETSEPTTPPTSEPTVPPTVDLSVDKFYMVVKVTDGNYSLTENLTYQGLEVTRDPATGKFSFRFFDGLCTPDHMRPKETAPAPTLPQVDMGSGYTAKEIAQMRAEQEKIIRDLQFQVKMAESNYNIKVRETQSGDVVAQIDGVVVSLLTEEEAKETGQPILKLSGGGGFYVRGSIGELQKHELLPGQTVTVNDWNTGMTYEGTVKKVEDFPTDENGWNGMGNPNVSYYPFTVFVDESADLQEGSYVSVVYSSGGAQQGIYLENAFLRTQDGKSYVYVRGTDGRLEQRFVTTGKSLWGSYTQILEGLTADDFLAFPYGKDVKPGAPTRESDISELYS